MLDPISKVLPTRLLPSPSIQTSKVERLRAHFTCGLYFQLCSAFGGLGSEVRLQGFVSCLGLPSFNLFWGRFVCCGEKEGCLGFRFSFHVVVLVVVGFVSRFQVNLPSGREQYAC